MYVKLITKLKENWKLIIKLKEIWKLRTLRKSFLAGLMAPLVGVVGSSSSSSLRDRVMRLMMSASPIAQPTFFSRKHNGG